jgi:succinyl-CoA synthetase beta subunit
VVKAQVHAGGRGKAGGVKMTKDLDAVRSPAEMGSAIAKRLNGRVTAK